MNVQNGAALFLVSSFIVFALSRNTLFRAGGNRALVMGSFGGDNFRGFRIPVKIAFWKPQLVSSKALLLKHFFHVQCFLQPGGKVLEQKSGV